MQHFTIVKYRRGYRIYWGDTKHYNISYARVQKLHKLAKRWDNSAHLIIKGTLSV